jgi:hypothetical protein
VARRAASGEDGRVMRPARGSTCRFLLLFLVCWTWAAPLRADEVVARLAFEAPKGPRFVLRAMLPVPDGWRELPRLGVRLPDETTARPAQAVVAARDATGAIELVELCFSGRRAPSAPAGGELVATVVLLDAGAKVAQAAAPATDSRIAELLDRRGSGRLYLRARDLHGHEYRAELTGAPAAPGTQAASLLASGPHLRRRRVAAVLLPVVAEAAGHGALPHLFGVHAYLTERADVPSLGIDLRIHNGLRPPQGDADPRHAPLGPVWFERLELVHPAGFVLEHEVVDPQVGPPRLEEGMVVVPLVRPLPGALHPMPAQAQFERRLCLRTDDAAWAAQDALGFADLGFPLRGRGLWSWQDLPRWLAARDPLPDPAWLDARAGVAMVRAHEAQALGRILQVLRSGEGSGWPFTAAAMGWCHPWFSPAQGATGGEGIVVSEGHWIAASATRSGVLRLSLQHRMTSARTPQAAWDRLGRPCEVETCVDEAGVVPFDYRMNGDIRLPEFAARGAAHPAALEQARLVAERGLRPAFDRADPWARRGRNGLAAGEEARDIHGWWPHDDQHLARRTSTTKALVWLANDALAKDELLHVAAQARLAMHERPHRPVSWSPGATLPVMEALVAARPKGGLPWGRGQAWMIDALASAHAIAGDDWRARHDEWFARATRLVLEGAMPSGLVMRVNNTRHAGHERHDTAQAFESLILANALRALAEGVHGAARPDLRDALRELHLRATASLSNPPLWTELAEKGGTRRGPRQIFPVAPRWPAPGAPYCVAEEWGAAHLPAEAASGAIETLWMANALGWSWRLEGGARDAPSARTLLLLGGGARDHAASSREWAAKARRAADDHSGNLLALLAQWRRVGAAP